MKYPVTNTTGMPIYVGALMIPPGETRHFDLDQLPPEHRPAVEAPAPEAPPDRLAEIAEMKVDLILPILADLNAEDLARLQLLEVEGKARKTVLEAIAAEGLKRASVKSEGEQA